MKRRRHSGKPKSPEELYDLKADPYQVNNLAGEVSSNDVLVRMRSELKAWMIANRDLGLVPEGEVLERCGKRLTLCIGA